MPFESTVGESDLVIGQEYFGSVVKKVKQTVEDKDGKYTVKRYVTLKTGMILVETYILTRGSKRPEAKEYGAPPGTIDDDEPKDDSALRAKAREMLAKKKEKPDKKKKKKTKKKKKPEFDLDGIYDVPAKVYPYSNLPETRKEGAPVLGSWKHSDGTDNTEWEPMDVVITKDPPTFLEPEEPHGHVALRNGAVPDKDGNVDPFDLKFFPPGEEPSFGFNRVGHWTPGNTNQDWPPVKPEPETHVPTIQKPKLPDFDGEFAKILPESQVPETHDADAPLTGVWMHNDDDNDEDDANWEPMYVDITTDPPSDLNPLEPHGIVAVEKGVEPDENGYLDPYDLKFCTPGEEPPPNYNQVGHWKPGKLNQEWPPKKPRSKRNLGKAPKLTLPDFDNVDATVMPKSKLPATESNRPENSESPFTGVWKHNDDTDDADWDPMKVIITKNPPLFLEPGEPHGIVAVEDGVKPNKVGRLDPSNLSFFTPGEKPPPNYNKAGHWRPGKVNQEWPPGSLPDFNGPAKVVPTSRAPYRQRKDGPLTGVWKHNDDTRDTDWEDMDVEITKDLPSDLEPGQAHGIVAVEYGVKPDKKTGKLKPSDLKFFVPGEKPTSAYNKVGHWRTGKLNQDWPPVKPLLPDFDGPAEVVPTSKAPYRQGDDDPLTGVWKHNDDTDDTNWDPLDVDVTKDFPSDLETGEAHGIVAVEEGVKPDKTGKLKPSDLKFFTPGEEPSPTYNKVGHWRPAKLNQDWPPVKQTLPDFEGSAIVVPKSKAPHKQDEDTPLTGVWKHKDGTDDTDWDPMDVIITKEPVSFLDPGEPNGIVAVKKDIKPNTDGTLDPPDICFFKPREEPPSEFKKMGHWRPGKLNQDWPPVKPILPDFIGPAKIMPKARAPYNQLKDTPLTGVWKHNDDTDDYNWDSLDVIISKEPDSSLEPGDIHGIVAIDKDARPNADGTLDPSDISFFTPDEEPPPAYNKFGHWRPAKLNQGWPPEKPELPPKKIARAFEKPTLPSLDGSYAKVVPKSKVHKKSIKDPPVMGVWEHNDDTDDTDWDPITVIITNDPEGDFHGIVAVEEGIKPNKVGKLDPSDLKFFTPGEELPANYTKLGHWTPAKKSEWPPSKPFARSLRSLRNVGKLNLPDFDGVPETGVIYPRSRAPETHDASKEQIIAKGVWKWSKPENKPEDSESWVPSKVDLCENGNEPHDWDDKKTHGVWGVNPDVDAKVNTKPTDLWFYPPNEKVDEGFEPIGKWRPSKKATWSYPPKPIGKIEDKREFKEFTRSPNSVGKLRVPSFFKGK